MIGVAVLILFWIMFNGTVVMVSGQRFGKCLPVSMLSMALVLYYTQFIFDTFNVGYVILIIVALAFMPLAIHKLKSNKIETIGNMFSLGFVSFVCSLFILGIIDYNRTFSNWDEWSHWGIFVKELLRLDNWYSADGTRAMVNQEYPPFATIFEMLSCTFSLNGYNESVTLFGLQVLSMSLVVPPMVDSIEQNRKMLDKVISMFLVNILIIFIINVFTGNADGGFNTIYKDIVLGLIFVYAITLVYNGGALISKFDYLSLVLATAALLITKQLGVAYAVLIWFYYVLSMFVNRIRNGKRILWLIVFPMFTYWLWSNYIKTLNMSGKLLDSISISKIKMILSDTQAETVQRQTVNSYIQALFTRRIDNLYVPLTYAGMFVVVIVLIYVVWRIGHNHWKKSDAVVLTATFICGTIGYAITLCITYMCCYPGTLLPSYKRYMSGYVFGEILILAIILYKNLNSEKYIKWWQMAIATIVCILVLGIGNLEVFKPGIYTEVKNIDCRQVAEFLEEHIDGDRKVYIISDDANKSQYYINYYADDIKVQSCYINALNADLSNEDTVRKIWNEINSADYLYIINVNDSFNLAFSDLNNGDEFHEGELYCIVNDTLEKVGSFE